ncbi:MAG: hypothetical protein WCF67_05565 [Chitinophagaceae bacterium]
MPFEKLNGSILFKPASYNVNKKYPLIIFLHGIGERGDGSPNGLTNLLNFITSQYNNIQSSLETVYNVNGKQYEFVMLAPQLPFTLWNWENSYVDPALQYAMNNLSIDWTKVYLTGVSLGGGGVWKYASTSLGNAQKFAALAPVCGVYGLVAADNIAKGKCGVWAFHAVNDESVPVGNTEGQVNLVNAANPPVPARKTIYPTGGHYIWARVYDKNGSPGIDHETVNLFTWFLLCSQGNPVPVPTTRERLGDGDPDPNPLTAHAGVDRNVIQGTSIVLDGSLSMGNITWAGWELLNADEVRDYNVFPNWDKSGLKKTLQNMYPGTYKFRLIIHGPNNTVASAIVTLTVIAQQMRDIFVTIDNPTGARKVIVYEDRSFELV